MYIETSDDEFISWLGNQLQEATSERFPTGDGVIRLGKAERRILLLERLSLEIDGIYTDSTGMSLTMPKLFQIGVTPVGLGKSIEITATCHEPALQGYLVRLLADIAHHWPPAGETMWAGEPRKTEHLLRQLKLRTSFKGFEQELKSLAAVFVGGGVCYVTLAERRNYLLQPHQTTDRHGTPLVPEQKRSWEVRLKLQTMERPWQSLDEIALDVEVSRIAGKYPLMMTVMSVGYKYREAEPFVEALAARCRAAWRVAPEAGKPGGNSQSSHPVEPRKVESGQTQNAKQRWDEIPDHAWDRKALALWWEDYSCPEIGEKLSQSAKTVLNRLSALRQMYGTEIVPTDKQRRERNRKVRTPG
ncbi:MAG: hypothetical protein HYZ49_14360 [Chloroflexi bacterium]|nr:hypothetical protein [Chloroflexota bacterium]